VGSKETVTTENTGDLYGSVREFQKCYQHRTNLVKQENSDVPVDSHSISKRWTVISIGF